MNTEDRLAEALRTALSYEWEGFGADFVRVDAELALAAHEASRAKVSDAEYTEYEVYCDGEFVASSDSQDDALHYGFQYAQDGEVTFKIAVTVRKPMDLKMRAARSAGDKA